MSLLPLPPPFVPDLVTFVNGRVNLLSQSFEYFRGIPNDDILPPLSAVVLPVTEDGAFL
jgi:hypothetical protein